MTDALLMCGGRGTRLSEATDREKPLVEVCGEPMVDRVLRALAGSRVDRVFAVVSPNGPETRAHLADRADATLVEGTGEGYVPDLGLGLERTDRPAVTVVADLPLLAVSHVNRALDRAGGDSLAVCVPVETKRRVGASADAAFEVGGQEVAPTGLNVVGSGADETWVVDDERLAVNVNRPADLALARRRCGAKSG